MKELTRVETSEVVGGGWYDRWKRQHGKCKRDGGYSSNNRHCRRANRILNRHMQ